jgi:orotidine-5'-phosphate decarboxylase
MCESIDRVGAPLCVGIDPVLERLPEELRSLPSLEAFEVFCTGILDVVHSIAPAVKFQSACFERLGFRGVELLGTLRERASNSGMQVILDAKRGDIGISAAHYATAVTADGPCDWVTVHPYLGIDGIQPFLEAGLGVYCLVRTSNPSGDAIQKQELKDGRTVAQSIADLIAQTGASYLGESGWSALGAVVGATKPDEAIELRKTMEHQMFLLPGIGAQGASVGDVQPCFADGHGGLVSASRSIIYPEESSNWQDAIASAANAIVTEIHVGDSV